MAFLLPISNLKIPPSSNHEGIYQAISQDIEPRTLLGLKIFHKSTHLATGGKMGEYLYFTRNTENFLIAGNLMLIFKSKHAEKPQKVWAIGNIFVLLLFLVCIFQVITLGEDAFNYANYGGLSIWQLISSEYLLGKLIQYLLPLLVAYSFLYFNLVYKGLNYWRKTLSNLSKSI